MTLFRRLFYRKPPDGLLEISERVFVFDYCFNTEICEDDEYKVYIEGIFGQLREYVPEASYMVFNFREGENESLIANILSNYDVTVIDYPRQYENCPVLTVEMIHHFLKSSESWLSISRNNVLLMHCERGGWPVLAFMLAGLLLFRKQYNGEQKTLDMIYKQAPKELLNLISPLNPLPSQLRYLQYISNRNVAPIWPPLDRALTLDCIILRVIPDMDGEGGCRPIFRIYGRDPLMVSDRTPKVLFSTPKNRRFVRYYMQVDCELVKIDINCHIQGDVVLECITLDDQHEREKMMFRVMFNTSFIRSDILMLNRDEIDILWNVNDQFAKEFKVEVVFSEMESKLDLSGNDEKQGLPIEAFGKVQDFFSNVDLLSSRKIKHPIIVSDSFRDISEIESPKSEEIQGKWFHKGSVSNPVSYCNSLQSSPSGPVSRFHSAPSLLGITSLLHDHTMSSSPSFSCLSSIATHWINSPEAVASPQPPSTPLPPPSPPPQLSPEPPSTSTPPPPPPIPTTSATSPPPTPPPSPPQPPPPSPPPPPPPSSSSSPPPPPPPNLELKESIPKIDQQVQPPPAPLSAAPLPHMLSRNNSIAPPPAPPPSAKEKLQIRSKSLQSKKSNLKPYHWLKLTRAVQGSLWADAQKPEEAHKTPEFDMSELESLFAASVPNSDTDGKLNRRNSGKSDKVNLIDLRRANNCEIMLAKVKIPLSDLMSLVLTLDDSALDVDQVDNLIKYCPTKEETELLKNYKGDKDNLGKCEQFFLELMKIPRVENKLRVFSFKIQFNTQVFDLRKNLNVINSACEEVRSSIKLKRIMQTILSLGNALNHGTARGSAVGFRLDSLLKLTDTRARNNKMTLMHYLCKVLSEKLPELLDFSEDLVNVEGASKIQLKYLAEEMQAISKGLEKVVQEFTASENDGPVSEHFCKSLTEFLGYAEAEARSLASLYSEVGRNADALAQYFGEDPARCPFEQVVSTLQNFVKMFIRAHNENCKQLEFEKKKALKDAENEKAAKLKTSKREQEKENQIRALKSFQTN